MVIIMIITIGSDHHMSCTHGYFISKNGANKLINANSITQNRGTITIIIIITIFLRLRLRL